MFATDRQTGTPGATRGTHFSSRVTSSIMDAHLNALKVAFKTAIVTPQVGR
jgi:hypothetical protein